MRPDAVLSPRHLRTLIALIVTGVLFGVGDARASGVGVAGGAASGVGVAGASRATTPAWPVCAPRTAPVRLGLTELSRTRHGRVLTLMLRSGAMGDVQPVAVLLPAHYDPSGRTRYHVLYLLHGAGGDYHSWLAGGAEQDLGTLPVIAVMPNGSEPGMDGNYTDWFAHASRGTAPAWESYHVDELLPFIDAHFPTLTGAAGRAVVGISMGGGGATKYAAEYPGTFGYVGTFSGEAHPLLPVALAYQPKTCRWGDPATEQVIWRDNDSADLAALGNLRGIRIFIRSGDGTPGPFDSATAPADPVEAAVRRIELLIEYGAHLENESLVAALPASGVRDADVRFFPGSHSWPYWRRDMREFVGWLWTQFRHPPHAPTTITLGSAHTAFSAWGWHFRVNRRVREFVYLRLARDRIRATGSGELAVTTPPAFRPGTRYRVRVGSARHLLVADRSGVLRFALDLGPSHRHQQTRFDAGGRRGWRTASATITPA